MTKEENCLSFIQFGMNYGMNEVELEERFIVIGVINSKKTPIKGYEDYFFKTSKKLLITPVGKIELEELI